MPAVPEAEALELSAIRHLQGAVDESAVAVEMHRAAPVSGLREHLGDRVDRAGGDVRAPQNLADVLDAARGRAGLVHFDDGLLDAGLAPFAALDDRGGEARALELGHPERGLARCGGEVALVAAGAVRRSPVDAFVGAGSDELVGLFVEHGVDGLLDGFPDQLAQFVFNGLFVE